ncbi:putative transcriptional regulatory TcrX domain protein [Mycobacteroides abscessus subsp. bolletii 103]|nr:putative transcriptional regulatory TcrX domain protein [Mycobacteroides abscessus subsp. bolletii 103]
MNRFLNTQLDEQVRTPATDLVLRKKIDTGREPMIHTLRGAGYVLKPAH